METKATPGPWRVTAMTPHLPDRERMVISEHDRIALVLDLDRYGSAGDAANNIAEADANAALIAAAPDLLDVCKTVLLRLDVEAAERGEDAVFICAALRGDLRAAVEKAGGNQIAVK